MVRRRGVRGYASGLECRAERSNLSQGQVLKGMSAAAVAAGAASHQVN
jgi:hypothetical protein